MRPQINISSYRNKKYQITSLISPSANIMLRCPKPKPVKHHIWTVHTTLCITYTATCNLAGFKWNTQQFWLALCKSQELLLSCYILNFYDLQSVIATHSGSLLHPRFLSHPFVSRKHTKNKWRYSTTSLICLHSTNSNNVTLHLLAQ